MKLERDFLRSAVARRIVLLFLVCAVAPVIALAALTYLQVRELFAQRASTELSRVAQDYASNLHDRLVLADQELRALAARGTQAAYPFVSLRAVGRPEAGDQGGAAGQTRAQTVVVAQPDGADTAHVELVHTQIGADGVRGAIVGALDAEFLWGDAGDLPAGIALCVHDAADRRLHCSSAADSEPDLPSLAAQTAALGSAVMPDRAGNAVLAIRRELFLPRFQTTGWSVVTWRAESDALAPANAFRGVFLPVALLAVMLAALLSLTQIRRTLVPLQALLAGTRRSAQQDFTTRVPSSGDDEFSELAGAFNAMNERLGRQFETLRALAEVDRAILARQDVDRIVEMVLVRMRTLLPARHVGIAIFDRNGGPMMRAYRIDYAHAATPTLGRLPADGFDMTGWFAQPVELTLDPQDLDHPLVRMLMPSGAQEVVAFPIIADTAVAGALVLGMSEAGTLGPSERAHARELGDRLGVAFATAAKDEELYYQAHYDALTALPNRLLFKDELGRRMAHARRDQRAVALLFVDLDHFKNVNDSAGHPAGDEVLRQAADRLRHCVRSGDALARLGGDEFTVVVSDLGTPGAPDIVARHIVEAMTVPFVVGATEHFLSASIGIAIHPLDGTTPEELLRNADTAMYRAKEAGRNRWIYFEERMNAAALARVTIERDLRRALDADEFRLVYQPQFELATGRLVAAEALLRWHHPEAGVLLPDAFIPRAEETGVIERLGLWVLQEACRQHQQWAAEGVVLDRIALNVSAPQFRHKDFVEQIGACLRQTGVPASCLELEITESVLMEPGRHVEAAFEMLDTMRVRIALDDFGTGYSSLAYLKRFPVHLVKIDRAFVADLNGDASSIAISGAIVGMAHALGKQVVAEGVETSAQAAILQRLSCDYVQGYHFGRPLAASDFAAMARRLAAARGAVPAI